MKNISLYIVITMFSLFLIIGCSKSKESKNNSQTNAYDQDREVAWEYMKDKGWDDKARGNWQSAKVTEYIVDKGYVHLLDNSYEGKEVLKVNFEDKENVVIGTPAILIDPETDKVIGYIPTD